MNGKLQTFSTCRVYKRSNGNCCVGLVLLIGWMTWFAPTACGQKTPLAIDLTFSGAHGGHFINTHAVGGGEDWGFSEASDTDPTFAWALDGGNSASVVDPHAFASGRAATAAWVWQDSGSSNTAAWLELLPIQAEGHELLGSYGTTDVRFQSDSFADWEIGDPGNSAETWIEGTIQIYGGGDYLPWESNSSYYKNIYGYIGIGDSDIVFWFDDEGIYVWGVLQDLDGPIYITEPLYTEGAYAQFEVRQYVDPEDIVNAYTEIRSDIAVRAGAGYENDFASLYGSTGCGTTVQAFSGTPD